MGNFRGHFQCFHSYRYVISREYYSDIFHNLREADRPYISDWQQKKKKNQKTGSPYLFHTYMTLSVAILFIEHISAEPTQNPFVTSKNVRWMEEEYNTAVFSFHTHYLF